MGLEMILETNERGRIGEREKVAKNYLFKPTLFDTFGNYKIKPRSNTKILSGSLLEEEEEVGRYER